MIIHTQRDLRYMPKPNWVMTEISSERSPAELTGSSFMIAFLEDGSVLLAFVNKRDRAELAGGHIEPGEDEEQTAIREGWEELRCRFRNVTRIGHLRMESKGEAPAGWPYAHPLSFQALYAGIVEHREEYLPNQECAAPVHVTDDATLPEDLRVLVQAARDIMKL